MLKNMNRRKLLVTTAMLPLSLAQAQTWPPPRSSVVDNVVLYVLPTDDVPEDVAANIARALTKETGLWVKASVRVPSGDIAPFAGTNQYPAEDYIALAAPVTKLLEDASPRTYFIVLTDRDINSRDRNFRFLYASHAPMVRTSVLSIARLYFEKDGSYAPADVMSLRVQKMLMRIAGEMKLGWKRSNDPTDLMYAPIMSIDDIDRMSLIHSVKRHKREQ
jgi:predicted Zn-dependent protease